MNAPTTTCPGCGLVRPLSERRYDRKFHASAECWSLFEQVLAREFQAPALFGKVHQLTVDTYAVQHAGGRHPDKSVGIHLVGLFLVMEDGLAPTDVAPRLQRIASLPRWPRLDPPPARASGTVLDVAAADGPEAHAAQTLQWAKEVWLAWTPHHETVRRLAEPARTSSRPRRP